MDRMSSRKIPLMTDKNPTRTRRRRWLFRGVAVLLGLTVFLVMELLFVAFDWGRPTAYDDPFVGFRGIQELFHLNDSGDRYHIPTWRRKYFMEDSFPAAKGKNTFRIFCLGGSTVQGRPFSLDTSFPTWLRLSLQVADPNRNWEVVNCGGISYASYRLAPILEECLQYEPDLFIICTGHNEFLEDRTYEQIKQTPTILALPQQALSRLRTYAVFRDLLLRASGRNASAQTNRRPFLRADVDTLLDYAGGLEVYKRDESWRAGVIRHYEFNVRRMVEQAAAAKVPVILVRPPSNLSDNPPFKSQHRDGLSQSELQTWDGLVAMAHADLRDDVQSSVGLFHEALAIDDQYAVTHYELGKCFESLGLFEQARDAFLQARTLDICPLRMIQPLETALALVVRESNTPLLDAHELLEKKSRNGILGGRFLVDHVHPSFEGNQMIADALTEELERLGVVSRLPDWRDKSRQAYQRHFEALPDIYFARGEETLKNLRAWAAGRVDANTDLLLKAPASQIEFDPEKGMRLKPSTQSTP